MTKATALDPRHPGASGQCHLSGRRGHPMIEAQAERYGKGDPDRYKADLLAHYPQGMSPLHRADGGGADGLLPGRGCGLASDRRGAEHRFRQLTAGY